MKLKKSFLLKFVFLLSVEIYKFKNVDYFVIVNSRRKIVILTQKRFLILYSCRISVFVTDYEKRILLVHFNTMAAGFRAQNGGNF